LVNEVESSAKGKALKHIRNAWIAALVSTTTTLGLAAFAASGGSVPGVKGISAWSFIDAVIMAGVTFGIYKRSRACAVFMLGYFIVSLIVLSLANGRYAGGIIAPLFLYFYARGAQGTYAWHAADSTAATVDQ
jgi:serine/threonine-protein kinase